MIRFSKRIAQAERVVGRGKKGEGMVDIQVPAQDRRRSDLLCNALEGGSNYWYMIEKVVYPKGKGRNDFEFPHIEVPFNGGALHITADGEPTIYTLDRAALDKGWTLLHEKHPYHYADVLNEKDDATTGDVYLQLCLFGEVIFG